jgi:hypothetical protein
MKSSNFFITLSEPLIFSGVLLISKGLKIYKKPRGNVGFIGRIKDKKNNTKKI